MTSTALPPSELSPEIAEEFEKQVEEKNKELDAEFEIEKPEPIIMPYDYLPNPMDRAALCYQAMAFLMHFVIVLMLF